MASLDYAKLKQRLEELQERISLLQSWHSMTKAEFLEDPKNNRAVLRVLQEAIESCISIASHIVSAMDYGEPNTYADLFQLLAAHDVIDKEFETELERMVGFRNRIVHRYWAIDWEEVYQIFSTRVEDFERFKTDILAFITAQDDEAP